MPTRNVNLTEYYDQLVANLIASGQYKNASEVMRAGLRLLERQAKQDDEKLAILRGLATEAFDALDQGHAAGFDGEQPLAEFVASIGRRAASRPGTA